MIPSECAAARSPAPSTRLARRLRRALACLALLLPGTAAAEAPDPAPATGPATGGAGSLDLDGVIALVREQQRALDEQRKQLASQQRLLESQAQRIETLTQELDILRAPRLEEQTVAASSRPGDSSPGDSSPGDSSPGAASPGAASRGESPLAAVTPPQTSAPESPRESAAQTDAPPPVSKTGAAVAQAQEDDPTRALLEDFRGAWRLPGTNAALAIGGFVKTSVVYNFDPLSISDRFIVGSIPVSNAASATTLAQSSLTAEQSRLNFDLREPTEFGLLRAFIEGDFAAENSGYRLRHAFGQWRQLLAGKTWSTFVDTKATPEEIDFEGLNGRINVRQSQLRFMPRLGEKYEFQFSLEDPNPRVQNGDGVTRAPDIVLSARMDPYELLHMRAALLLRQIRAQDADPDGRGVTTKRAAGLSLSGSLAVPLYDERDYLSVQLNYGDGIGRYVNDLSSIGNFDGIFDPQTGELELFDIFSGYVSFQHWWGRNTMRSNFTAGVVDVDNPDFVEGDAYRRTIRLSTNLIWSPTPRIDLGGEYLWGLRENEDGSEGDAQQIQFSLRYRF